MVPLIQEDDISGREAVIAAISSYPESGTFFSAV